MATIGSCPTLAKLPFSTPARLAPALVVTANIVAVLSAAELSTPTTMVFLTTSLEHRGWRASWPTRLAHNARCSDKPASCHEGIIRGICIIMSSLRTTVDLDLDAM